MADKFGYITQVIGPVVDVAFEGEGNEVPPIYAALKIERENGAELIVEVEQHFRRPLYQYRDALYGNQGDRFTRTVFKRWKDRFVRRGRCW